MLMYKEEGGFHNFAPHEVEAALADGWVDGNAIREKFLAMKRGTANSATIEAQTPKRAGRPRKSELPSFLTGAINGDSSDTR